MKKLFISLVLMYSSILFASSTIELTGKYSQNLGNPFKVLLEKKDKSISIFSNQKDIVLVVESNLDTNSMYNNNIHHPDTYILKNGTVRNILKQFYEEEYLVKVNSNANVLVNVLSGNINLDYTNYEKMNKASHLRSAEVILNIELIINGKQIKKTISMDNDLGIKGDNYNWTIQRKINLNIENLKETIQNIIEYEIYVLLTTIKG